MERHFGGDMAKLCAYIAQQPAEQQKAVIDGSEALRDFLGIRNPDGFRKKFLSSSSSSSRIQDADAPAALAMAALCASKETRVLRALTRLDETLDKNLSRFQDNNSYRQTVQTAFHQLMEGIDKLPTDTAQQKAAEIIDKHLPKLHPLNPEVHQGIRTSATHAMARQGINAELRNRLENIRKTIRELEFGTMPNAGSIRQNHAGNSERARFNARLNNSGASSSHQPSGQSVPAEMNNEPPPKVPERLREKIDAVNLRKIARMNKEFSKYAQLVVDSALKGAQPGTLVTALDEKHLALIAAMENERNPGLNLHVFKSSKDCYKFIKEKASEGTAGNYRIIYRPNKATRHHIALDIKIAPGKQTSIILFESALPQIIPAQKEALSSNIENSKVHAVANLVQNSEGDCIMFALHNALKLFKTSAKFAAKIHRSPNELFIDNEEIIPPVFKKHSHSRAGVINGPHADAIVSKAKTGPDAEALLQRVQAYRTDRSEIFFNRTEIKHYSTSIEGFRLQEIKRVGDYLMKKASA